MSVNVNLTKKQYNKLMKGEKVRLKNEQIGKGNYKIQLDNNEFSRLKRNMKQGKGFQIDHGNLSGSGIKDVFKSVKKGVKKAVKVAQPILKDVYRELKPIAKEVGKEALKQNRKYVDLGLKNVRERSEKQIEDILTPYIGKELAQDITTENSAYLSKKASQQLDKLEGRVDQVMRHPEINMVKGRDYDVLKPYNVNEEGLNLPVAVATEIQNIKGSGLKNRRVIYLKGEGAKSFFRKLGRTFGRIIKSKPVKKIFSELAKTGVSALTTSLTGSPIAGEMAKNLTGNLVESGVNTLADTTGEAMGGGLLTTKKTMLKNSGGALYVPSGGALYVPTSRGRGRCMCGRGLNGNDTTTQAQGGEYLISA